MGDLLLCRNDSFIIYTWLSGQVLIYFIQQGDEIDLHAVFEHTSLLRHLSNIK